MSNDTKDTKKKLASNTWGVVCCRKFVVEGVSNDTKDSKKKLAFNTWGVVYCRKMVVEEADGTNVSNYLSIWVGLLLLFCYCWRYNGIFFFT